MSVNILGYELQIATTTKLKLNNNKLISLPESIQMLSKLQSLYWTNHHMK